VTEIYTIKLWIDDERRAPTGWFWCKTGKGAIRYILDNWRHVVEISFDHDLGGSINGADIAHFIEHMAKLGMVPHIKWHVHSDNGPGRDNIIRAMQSAERFWGLDLDHIDGNRENNLDENLRLLCPTCHAQTPTYKGKNIKKRRKA